VFFIAQVQRYLAICFSRGNSQKQAGNLIYFLVLKSRYDSPAYTVLRVFNPENKHASPQVGNEFSLSTSQEMFLNQLSLDVKYFEVF